MKLFIDSTDNQKTIIRLDNREFIRKVANPREQDVFGFIIKTLQENGFDQSSITEVEVNPGPGSFTGTRIGVAIANALGFALGVKINGSTKPITPVYSAPASITKPKVMS